MKRICTICARAGSKGVKNKNIRSLLGKPLIAHSIEQAKASGVFDAVAVSSDSADILAIASEYGADYAVRRPDEMATDTASKLPAIIHCTLEVEKITGDFYDIVTELDPTSPLRSIQDIRGAMELFESKKVTNVITAAPARRSPYFNLVEINSKGAVNVSKQLPYSVIRRQDSPQCYDMNASIYIWNRGLFFKDPKVFYPDTALYEMPEERSYDIDSELDFQFVEFLLQKRAGYENQRT